MLGWTCSSEAKSAGVLGPETRFYSPSRFEHYRGPNRNGEKVIANISAFVGVNSRIGLRQTLSGVGPATSEQREL